ncbi:MAG TPA: type VI secretion system protein TssL, long form, partial [Stellaceae bacterium]|nr:type VI secretion system protein TssL, long form [Stellaceae bacterium]
LVVYMGLSFALSTSSDPAFGALAQLPPREGVTVAAATPPPPPRPRPGFLAPEIAQGLVSVQETDQRIVVTIRATGMFASGSATVEPRYVDLLKRIGDEIEKEKETGKVLVLGHTDNVPIRTLKFPSNFELSLARAKAAAAVLGTHIVKSDRVSAEGRADADPVQPNTTPAGREANRRIEIVIIKGPKA